MPSEYQDIRISTTGSYSGVGLEVSSADNEILVVAPIDGTPAFRAGIQSGDKIVAIDDASVRRDGLQETISRLRGRPGTRVNVSVLRGPETEVLVFNLRRERIRVASVRHDTLAAVAGLCSHQPVQRKYGVGTQPCDRRTDRPIRPGGR